MITKKEFQKIAGELSISVSALRAVAFVDGIDDMIMLTAFRDMCLSNKWHSYLRIEQWSKFCEVYFNSSNGIAKDLRKAYEKFQYEEIIQRKYKTDGLKNGG